MADTPHRVLFHLSVCPICFDAAGALTDGARAGAAALAVVAAVVLAGFVRFAWRLR
jgi:hypothetical protein